MNNLVTCICILLAYNYQPLNASTVPLIKQLNAPNSKGGAHQPNILVTFPVTKMINAQKLNNFGKGTAATTKNNFDTTVIDSIIDTNELIRNFLTSIDFDKIFDRFDTITLGKVLRHLFKQVFPHGVSQKLTDALCDSAGKKNISSTKKSTSTTTEPSPSPPITAVTPDSLYYRTTEKSKQLFSYVEPIVENTIDKNNDENYDDVLTSDNLADLKEEPITDDYIEDEAVATADSVRRETVELKKTKREIDDDINSEITLLTWLQSLFAA